MKSFILIVLFISIDRACGWLLLLGLERYYGMDIPAQVLCVGHSQTVLGIDKVALEHALGVPVAKFAVEGANTADRFEMIRYYLRRQCRSVRVVVYDVCAHTFTSSGLSSSSYKMLYPFIDDTNINDYIWKNSPSKTEYWIRRLLNTARFNEMMLSLSLRGYMGKWSNLKFSRINVERYINQVREGRYRKIGFDADNTQVFDKTANYVTNQQAVFSLTYIPTIDILNQAEPEKFERCMDIFRSKAVLCSNIKFFDYNAPLQGQHNLFFDPIHLNQEGQKELTARLGEDLKPLLDNRNIAGK